MKLGASILALVLSSFAQAANIDIQWATHTYPDTTAQVGDTITFTWSSTHNVNIHPSGTCDDSTGAILVGETSPVTYTFTANDANKDLFFICGIPGHCDAGQSITVSVSDGSGGGTTAGPVEPSSVPMVSGSLAPSAVVTGGSASGSVVPTNIIEIGSQPPSSQSGMGTPAPTSFGLGNETETGVPTISPMDNATIPTMGPSAVGGSAGGTQAPSVSSPAADGSSGASRGSVAGLASATLVMALALFIE